jgi:NB-ARC domain
VDPAALVVALVVGLFKKLSDKGGDRIADELTDAAAAKVRELLGVIRERLRPEDPAGIALAELERDPANRSLERVLAAQMTKLLADDQPLNHRLTDLLQQVLDDNHALAEALSQRPAISGAHAESHGVGSAVAVAESSDVTVLIGKHHRLLKIHEAERPAAAPRELPPEPRYFTGRDALRSSLVHELRRREDAVPRVLITGEPGVGKTGLALHVAHNLRRTDYPDIQLFIPLSAGGELPVPRETALYDALIALDVPRDRIPAGIDARRRRYRAELDGKAVLVVLDDAVDADQVEALVPPAGCAMIVTSRDELHEVLADDARAVRLQPLSRREAIGYLAKRIGPARVGRELTGAVRIANACDRLPLPLTVVAAQLTAASGRTLNLNEMAWRLSYEQTRVEQLTAGRRSVQAAFAKRYRTLTDEQRELFQVLGVLNTAEVDVGVVAAALGVSEEDAAARLRDLVDAGLLEVAGGR